MLEDTDLNPQFSMDNITSSKEDEVSFGSALNPFDHEIALRWCRNLDRYHRLVAELHGGRLEKPRDPTASGTEVGLTVNELILATSGSLTATM